MNDAPCDKHELRFCGECSGAARAHDTSLKEKTHWEKQRDGELESLPYIPGGPTIYSKFAGNCAGCGRRYDRDTPIHYSAEVDGWIGVDCCAAP